MIAGINAREKIIFFLLQNYFKIVTDDNLMRQWMIMLIMDDKVDNG